MSKILFLAWHSEDGERSRWSPVGRLERINGLYRFTYTRGAEMLEGFQPLSGMPDFHDIYESEELFPFFANRLLRASRPEFKEWLEWAEFDPDNPPDPIAILAVTEGKRATDSFEVFSCPEPDSEGRYVMKFFLRGIRWRPSEVLQHIDNLAKGDELGLRFEEQNLEDVNAVAVLADDLRIGYVPRYLARDIRELRSKCDSVSMEVERVNKDAPIQQRLLCRVESCWPDDFDPCSKEEFQPLASSASRAT